MPGPDPHKSDLPFTTSPVPDSPSAVFWRNRAMNLFDQLPLPAAFCQGDGTILRVNQALAAEWGTFAGPQRGYNAFQRLHPVGDESWAQVTEGVRLHRRARYTLVVAWTASDEVRRTGRAVIDVATETPESEPHLVLVLHTDALWPEPEVPGPSPLIAGTSVPRILALAAAGATTDQIADAVGITADGVNHHLRLLSRRWGVRGKTALVARAYAEGILDPSSWPPRPHD